MESPLFSPAGFIKNSAQIVFLGVQKGEEVAAPRFVLVQAVLLQKNGSVIAKCFQLFLLLFLHWSLKKDPINSTVSQLHREALREIPFNRFEELLITVLKLL